MTFVPLLLQIISATALGDSLAHGDTVTKAPVAPPSVKYVLVQYKQVFNNVTRFDPNLALRFRRPLMDALGDTTRVIWENTTDSAAHCPHDEACDVVWVVDSVAEAADRVLFTLWVRIGNTDPRRSMARPWPLEPAEDVERGRTKALTFFANCVKQHDREVHVLRSQKKHPCLVR